MATVIVDGQEVELGADERINGIQAAAKLGIDVPHYCWHPGLSVVASCRMCLVEVGSKNPETGEVSMMPKLMPACQTPAKDGTVFVTNSEKVHESRAMVEEYLLMDHPIDCPICDKAGECYLQDYHFKYGQKERRLDIKPFHSRRRDVGPTVTLFVDRCVMCSRCVRFCREVSGTSELMVIQRGQKEEIDVFRDDEGNIARPLENKLSGNVVDLCPVGALGDKDFLYQQRVWYMKSHAGVCAGCSTGCSIKVQENQDTVYRIKPRENPEANQWWICDEGRYGFHYVNDADRLAGPWEKQEAEWKPIEWPVAFESVSSKLEEATRVAVTVSPMMTVEEAYLLCKLARSFDEEAVLVLGPIPTQGENETFKGGFTIHAEKCPNRRGVEEVLKHFGGSVDFSELCNLSAKGEFDVVWIVGGYPNRDLISEDQAKQLNGAANKPSYLIVQDLFSSPLSEQASLVLPATAFTEKDGSFVNFQDRLQTFRWAVRPKPGVRSEGGIFQQLLGEKGLYKSHKVLSEIAGMIDYFSAAAEPIPETGVDLTTEAPAKV